LNLPNVYAFFLSTLLVSLMGFRRLGVNFYSETALDYTQSKLNGMRHAWYVVSHQGPLDSGGLKRILLVASLEVI
jgi:hypothetical protein